MMVLKNKRAKIMLSILIWLDFWLDFWAVKQMIHCVCFSVCTCNAKTNDVITFSIIVLLHERGVEDIIFVKLHCIAKNKESNFIFAKIDQKLSSTVVFAPILQILSLNWAIAYVDDVCFLKNQSRVHTTSFF